MGAREKHPFCPNRGGGVYELCKLVSVEEIVGGRFCVFLESLVQATLGALSHLLT